MSDQHDVPGWTNNIVYSLELTREEMALREQFAKEYVVDFNAYNACLRMGMASGLSVDYARLFLQDSYVQHVLTQLTFKKHAVDPNDDPAAAHRELMASRQKIIAGLEREAFNYGAGSTQSARVAALSRLAAIYKLDESGTQDDDDIPKGGVMVVPQGMTNEQWEAAASDSQNKLAEDSLRDVKDS